MFRVKDNSNRDGYSDTAALYMLYTRDAKSEALARTLDERCDSEEWRWIDRKNRDILFNTRNISNYVRHWDQNDGIFMYNNCPCEYERIGINGEEKTKVQMRQYIYKPIPTCSYTDMKNAYDFYENILKGRLNDPVDSKMIDQKMRLLKQAFAYRDTIYRNYGWDRRNELIQREKRCPETWISKIRGR
jgi:hypothetical protein